MRRHCLGLALALMVRPAAAGESARPAVSLAFGGEGSFTLSPVDQGYFNGLDYGHSALRLARLSLTGRLKLRDQAAVLTEVRSENADSPRVHALYLSLHPWRRHDFDIQIGRIPSVFGAYSRRGYGPSEPLAGVPLAYQYLTTLRADSVPATGDDVLRQRGRGWNVHYPIGHDSWDSGLPLVSAFQWDTGIQVRVGSDGDPVEVSAAVTQGSLSHPQLRDDNRGKQVAARVALHPVGGLVAGVSAARGEYLDDVAARAAAELTGRRERFHQEALGFDLEYAWGYSMLRAEAIWSRWEVPAVRPPFLFRPLGAWAVFVEGRQRLRPGLTLAARAERLQFTRIRGSAAEDTWDAPVTRLEAALAYAVRRQLIAKAAYQYNWRDARWNREVGLVIGQLVVWF